MKTKKNQIFSKYHFACQVPVLVISGSRQWSRLEGRASWTWRRTRRGRCRRRSWRRDASGGNKNKNVLGRDLCFICISCTVLWNVYMGHNLHCVHKVNKVIQMNQANYLSQAIQMHQVNHWNSKLQDICSSSMGWVVFSCESAISGCCSLERAP